jgi:hypothetical protein
MGVDNTRNFDFIRKNNIQNLFNCYYNKKNDQIYKMLLVLFKSKQPRDFVTGDVPNKSSTKKLFMEEHHIFPHNSKIGQEIVSKYEATNDNIINNIANIALITKETNNKRISNKNPSMYIKEILEDMRNSGKEIEFYNYMETHFISRDMVEMLLKDAFEDFILERTKLIYEYMLEKTS